MINLFKNLVKQGIICSLVVIGVYFAVKYVIPNLNLNSTQRCSVINDNIFNTIGLELRE